VALTDLNSQYVVERTGIGVALVIEGLILIGTGLVAERLRRAMSRRRVPGGGSPPMAPDAEVPPSGPPPAEAEPSGVPTP
jgi:hypothetical protein